MTTTNRAFIDAYRTPRPAFDAEPSNESSWTREAPTSTMAGAQRETPSATTRRIETAHSAIAPTEAKKQRRPLSQVQADELFGLGPATTASGPEWPRICRQLIAMAADRYDAVLRSLPNSPTGLLVGVVGPAGGAGCTTTAMCLALRSSALGFGTALVDGHFQNPALAEALGIDRFTSWAEALANGDSVAPALRSDDLAEVDLLLAHCVSHKVLEADLRFHASLAAGLLRRKYQRVVVDLGCVGPGDSSMATELAAAMGIDVLLAATSPGTTDQLPATQTTLAEHGLHLAGVVEATAAD